MKKSLVALAALAIVGVASAQSSVTLYGVADLSLAKATGGKTQMSGNGLLNNGNSRLGVRGTEDLGGGLKASFNFEEGINLESGATDANTFQRNANMSLSGGFGTFQMGRTLSPSFYGTAAWELTGMANYSMVANKFGFGGAGNPRNNSQFTYITPNMGGFSSTLGYITQADNLGNAKADINVVYRGGPLAVGLVYSKVENAERNVALGAKYDFGMFKVAGSFQDPAGPSKGFTIGGTANLGVASLTLDVGRDTNNSTTDTLIEALYPMSKRTTAYAAALRQGLPGVTNYGVGIRHNF